MTPTNHIIQLLFSADDRENLPKLRQISSRISIENLLSLEYQQKLIKDINKIIKKNY